MRCKGIAFSRNLQTFPAKSFELIFFSSFTPIIYKGTAGIRNHFMRFTELRA